jgi:hypothetical protein
MRAVLHLHNKGALSIALACLVLGSSLSAFAVPAPQVARILTGQEITATCCVPIGPTVRINEPATVTPVIVTFNADYVVNGTAQFGLSVNGAPCTFFGASVAPSLSFGSGSNGAFNSSAFNWVVLPSDGLLQGSNTFTLCAGGASAPVKIDLGFRTLSVQIGK